MKVRLTIHEKEVLRPVKLPTETKEFDLSTLDDLLAYNIALQEATNDGRIIWMEEIKEKETVEN